MRSAKPSPERLCWRAWPCHVCSKGLTPIGRLIRCREANPAFQSSSIEEIIRLEIADLQKWVSECAHTPEVSKELPKISEGSEHLVYLDAKHATVFKTTKIGIFGESYYLDEGKMSQQNCSPLDYLIRLRLWNHVFGSAPKTLGITPNGQIVSFHDFITGTPPDQDEVDLFLAVAGFHSLKRKYWLWKKDYPNDAYSIGLGDARADNFVKSKHGIVPIDVRLWFA